MSTFDIPIDKAELLSVFLEALLYGFSLLMFGGTIWTLFHRSTRQVNTKMLAVACALLVCSTAHVVIDIIRAMEGLLTYRDTFPGGPSAYFMDVSQWTFVAKNYVYTTQTLIGDGVILYRCYAVWQSKLVMIIPVLLWCSTGAFGIVSCYTASRVSHSGVFVGTLSRLITSFWATALATNLLATLLLLWRIRHIDRKTMELCYLRESQLRPVLHILVDAGAIYSLTLFVALICFVSQTNGQYVVLDMIPPIISITFYMVIIRVGLAARASQTMSRTVGNTQSVTAESRPRMQVRIATFTETEFDVGRDSLASPSPICDKTGSNGVGLDGAGTTT